MTNWQFWIDRGGTFTDIVAHTPDEKVITRKLLSDNPELYQDAALQGIRDILQLSADEVPPGVIDSVKMGTTVGTNALLERKGEAVALLINRGHRDCLRIGYQNRPDIFALKIRRPAQLYQRVVEIDARITAQGEILRPLDLAEARRKLEAIYQDGIRAVAIALLHAWRYPDHERTLGQLARAVGFTQISLSHQVSPLPKMVARAATCVLDAYLSPLLRRYVGQVQQGLSEKGKSTRLLFMQSNGGLVSAKNFQGKDSILSGPAGGIVGAIAVAESAGLKKIIAFDMGGTSTDVAHYAGELERAAETEIAGLRLRTSMLHIHTVAAGGGSILTFDGLRYRVGPESAGANPGPACYRRNGPLTVTDANLLLGKLPHFPKVFGAKGDLPPDADLVRQRFTELSAHIQTATGDSRSPEQVAEGFLLIAVENMAEAIKKISVQKGYPLGDYALCCYGAAGAQHACLLADRLGMQTVLLHPLAGVLSAYGIGLADFRIVKEQAAEELWEKVDAEALAHRFRRLEQQARLALEKQGIDGSRIQSHWRISLRFQGTDTAVSCNFAEPAVLLDEFEQRYRRQFGFYYQNRPLIMASVQVECSGKDAGQRVDFSVSAEGRTGRPDTVTQLFSQNRWRSTPVYRREQMPVESSIAGPAIVVEPMSTIVIEPGWRGQLRSDGNVLLTRCEVMTKSSISADRVDPVLLEIFGKRFMSVAEQMGFVLQNTAHSVNIKERLDFSCALFDSNGSLIANAPHIPVHLGSMGESVKALLQRYGYDLQPGDAYLTNSPYAGGTHLPDITVITPVFIDKHPQPQFFVASRGHHADVGGISPGSMPAYSRHIDDEGVLSDGLKLVDRGHWQEAALRQWLASNPNPARNPEQNLADLQAQIAANQKGAQELKLMTIAYSLPVVLAYMHYVQDHAEACVRRLLTKLPEGRFDYMLDQGARIAVQVSIDRNQRSAIIDFTGASLQLPDNFNAPAAVVKAAVLYVFRTLLKDDIPLNAGCLKPLTIRIPAGSMLNPEYPAAVAAGNVETSQYIVDALYGALGVLAGSQGTMNNFSFGDHQHQYYETICGGAGAGEGFDGTDAVHTHMTNSRMTDTEILEQRFPVVVTEFSVRAGSGGPGRYYGGDGAIRRIQFRAPMQVTLLSSHRIHPPFGLNGGLPGTVGRNVLVLANKSEHVLPGCVEIQVNVGDLISIETPGGGGFGLTD
jgi:5-oxoprolinase (ATP-hydrolysing)